jgi:predicted nucleotidyltransferase
MALDERLKEKREEVLRLCAAYGASSLFDLSGLQYELERLQDRSPDVVTERRLKARIRDRVLREAVPL